MKKIFSVLCASVVAMSAIAANPSDLKVYINPGHGGYDSDDRVMTIHPFTDGDTATFAESKSNLGKGFRLRELLWEKGYNVEMSRVRNTTDDDLGLSTIVALSNKSGADLFLSIHSNATGVVNRRNFPLILFRGYDGEAQIPGSLEWATYINQHLLTNESTVWTSTSLNVRGDWSFQPSWGQQGYGVLRGQTVTSVLSEGSFHDYIPETYRLLNSNFHWIEAWNFRKAANQYFGIEGVEYGAIAGRINDERVLRSGDFKMYDDDLLAPVHNVKVELYDAAGAKVAECVTDELYNGIYAFRKVNPGNYKLKFVSDTHYGTECNVTVVADKITYSNVKMKKVRNTPPEVISYSPQWKDGDEPVLCNAPVRLQFNWDMDAATTEAAFSITPAVEGTITWEDQNYCMVFTPNPTYNISTEYTVKLAATAEHAGGTPMTAPLEFKFFTTDRNFMKITGQFPNEGDKVHYKSANVEVRFDKIPNIQPILEQVKVYDSAGNEVQLNKRSMKYSKADAEYGYFRIPFSKDLVVGETYTLNLSKEISDKDGLQLQEGVVVKFQAVDAGEAKTNTVIDNMEDASIYTLYEQGCNSLKSAKAANNTANKLFDSKCVAFTYEFEGEEAGEAHWTRAAAEAEFTSADALGVHLFGDLTANQVYAEFTTDSDVKYVPLCSMTFLGWRYLHVSLASLDASKTYKFTGLKVAQTASNMSRTGTFYVDDISLIAGGSGIPTVELADLKVYPNPASEYLIASADGIIDFVQLTALNGATVAVAQGNILNVSEVAEGTYLVNIYTNAGRTVRKVVVKH